MVYNGLLINAKGSKIHVAVKSVKKQESHSSIAETKRSLKSLMFELKMYIHLQEAQGHQNIVRMLSASTTGLRRGKLLVALDLCFSLVNVLKTENAFRSVEEIHNKYSSNSSGEGSSSSNVHCYNLNDLIRWSYEVSLGMGYLANRNVRSKLIIRSELT